MTCLTAIEKYIYSRITSSAQSVEASGAPCDKILRLSAAGGQTDRDFFQIMGGSSALRTPK
jgi:hypothetical protein